MHKQGNNVHFSGDGKFLYVDCSSGISGDMFLSALTDLAGKCGLFDGPAAAADASAQPGPQEGLCASLPAPLAGLQELFRRAGINVTLEIRALERISGPGLHLDVLWPDGQPLRHLEDLTAIIAKLEAPAAVRERAVELLGRLAGAEAAAHGVDVSQVHFHEVGAIDTLVDVFGACWLLDRLGIAEVHSTPLPWFGGFVDCSHGRMALPAPATLELMRGKPFVMSGAEEELITPTGALLLDGLVSWGANGPAEGGHEHGGHAQHTHEDARAHACRNEHRHAHPDGHHHDHAHAHGHGGHGHEHAHGHHHHAHASPHAHHEHHGHHRHGGSGRHCGHVSFPAGARYLGCGVGYGSREPSPASDWPGRGLRLHLFEKPAACCRGGLPASGMA